MPTSPTPYRASAAAHIDMIAGRAEVIFDTFTSPVPWQGRSGSNGPDKLQELSAKKVHGAPA
jgi:hypothetical protein